MATQREVKQRYDQARLDAKEGKYAEALEGCLFFLDNSASAGVRLSYTLSDIMALSEHLPAAREALATRRDRCEEQILNGSGGYSEISDLTSFNKYLGEQDRSLALLDKLAHASPAFQELHLTMLDHLWEPLAEEGFYERLEPIIEARARSIAGHLADSYIRWSFTSEGSHEYSRDLGMVRYKREHALLAYKVLIALHKDNVAEALARWVLKCDPYMAAEALLAAAVVKARLRDKAGEIDDDAA